jgi:6-methylsalicylate decarboxylase
MRVDVHQHLWSEPLLDALAERDELPFVRREHGLTVLFLAGERPYVVDLAREVLAHRAALLVRDGVERALVCLSSPLGIECLPREQSLPLIDAYHEGALALGAPFDVWGAIALDRAEGADVDRALARGCIGVSLPAGALAGIEALHRVQPLLERLEDAGAPLLVHPGPGLAEARAPRGGELEPSLADPLWWSALTRYVSQMHAAWLTFLAAGRAEHPRLRVIFTMLAGLAPLHAERLGARGGPAPLRHDPLTFYETSSYGRNSIRRIAEIVGREQILYGSDVPVVDPGEHGTPDERDWDAIVDGTRRALGEHAGAGSDVAQHRDDVLARSLRGEALAR